MNNLLTEFRRLLPRTPLLVGTVQAVTGAQARIETDDGGLYTARDPSGSVIATDRVFFRPGGVIESTAPTLTDTLIEI
jgi:hypothetical protein